MATTNVKTVEHVCLRVTMVVFTVSADLVTKERNANNVKYLFIALNNLLTIFSDTR